MPVSLQGKAVLVVGASSGIGRECAIQFAREGAKVMASARRETRLRELPAPLEIFVADAGKVSDMDRLAEAAHARIGPVDILVYATGTNVPDRSMKRLNESIWDRMINVNLNGAYYITRALLPGMRERRSGHLIYISSISGLTADVSGAAYQAAKRGLLGLAHAIRMEEKANGIRTCVLCPGLVDTEILQNRPEKTPAETVAKALQAEDVAEMVLAIAKLPERASVPELQLLPTLL